MAESLKNPADYTAADLENIAQRAESYRGTGFFVPPSSIDLYVAAIKALAEKRKR
ncbi:hypothetical protein [Methylobacterium brachythecii]|uniref:Uncharacterized protein n=1 Tax=Methylobacterium brachythecii TaxID=1176177 RepID=A0A7W6ALU8_9HYPH|nr:hypothetical protein [Methylobacterium brachythecii]MBB3902072.1 hypothetical protein [Methylobacterium brachythecii]GLS44469.1 hypothetical protein GCM10007884_24570 [Methylobacterium brachythecii]